jgi:hypothetical protein
MEFKTVDSIELAKAYTTLYPEELVNPNLTPDQCFNEIVRILSNWLDGYTTNPQDYIRGSNWYGKVTKSLFLALNIKQPKTVKAMVEVLRS